MQAGCDSPPGFFATIWGPNSQDPDWELEVTVPSDFNDDPDNSVQFNCTVRDDFDSDTATMTLTVN